MYKVITKKLSGDFEIQQGQLFKVHNFGRGEGQEDKQHNTIKTINPNMKKTMVKAT
jgi:hypothetical protein